MIDRESYDCLYLLRDDKQDICVDLPQFLPQHQLDGIRYLFRQFKKRNPGVILNDPSGYGKCLQVVLFLQAVRPTLNKPILILCNDNAVENWKQHFEIWTNCIQEVAVQTSNPYAKNTVFINSFKDGRSFSRRNWGIVVVHDNDVSRDVLQLKYTADYKIWVTSNNLKDDLHKLSLIYEWLHPNTEINLDNFKSEPKDYMDMVSKSLLLDAYLEDFFIRRDDFYPLFKKDVVSSPKETKSEYTDSSVEHPKVSRKNKDPTGTKVKRSKKRRLDDEVATEPVQQKVPCVDNIETNSGNEFNYNNKNEGKTFNNESTKDTNRGKKCNNKNVGKSFGNKSTKHSGQSKELNYKNKNEVNKSIKDSEYQVYNFEVVENIKVEAETESLTLEFANALKDLVQADNYSLIDENVNSNKDDGYINDKGNELDRKITNSKDELEKFHNLASVNDTNNDFDNSMNTKGKTDELNNFTKVIPINNTNENINRQIGTQTSSYDIPTIEVNTTAPIETLREGIENNRVISEVNSQTNDVVDAQTAIDSDQINADSQSIVKYNASAVNSNTNESKVGEGSVDGTISSSIAKQDTITQTEHAENVIETKKESDSDELEKTLFELEQKVLSRLKGSFFDRIF